MNTKYTLWASIFTLFVGLLNSSNIFAYVLMCGCDEVKMYCNYDGMYHNINAADEEFKMLSEPPRHANFQDMYTVISYIFDCAEENPICMEKLKDSDCNISKYTKKLVEFYEDDNNTSINDERVVSKFVGFRNGEGKIFFSKDEKENF